MTLQKRWVPMQRFTLVVFQHIPLPLQLPGVSEGPVGSGAVDWGCMQEVWTCQAPARPDCAGP